MRKREENGWIDRSGRKCGYPPPGMCLSPANPFTVPATSRSAHSKGRALKTRHIQEGVYYNRHEDKYIAYWYSPEMKEKFRIGGYNSYSEAIEARKDFLGE